LAAEKYPETAKLQQIKGVGPLTALAFVLTLEDPVICKYLIRPALGYKGRGNLNHNQ
jgi:hypothetical protein